MSDTTLHRDRVDKQRIYAKAGIPIYWIINLVEKQVEVYRQPYTEGDHAAYREQVIYGEKDDLPVMINDQQVARLAVSDILP